MLGRANFKVLCRETSLGSTKSTSLTANSAFRVLLKPISASERADSSLNTKKYLRDSSKSRYLVDNFELGGAKVLRTSYSATLACSLDCGVSRMPPGACSPPVQNNLCAVVNILVLRNFDCGFEVDKVLGTKD